MHFTSHPHLNSLPFNTFSWSSPPLQIPFTSFHFTYHIPTPVLGNTWLPPYFKFPSPLNTFLTFSLYILDFPALQIPFTSIPAPVTGNTRFPPQFEFPSLHFTSLITFLTLFLKVLGLNGKFPKEFKGSLFHSWMVLLIKEHFLISILCLLFLIFQSWLTLLTQYGLFNLYTTEINSRCVPGIHKLTLRNVFLEFISYKTFLSMCKVWTLELVRYSNKFLHQQKQYKVVHYILKTELSLTTDINNICKTDNFYFN